MTENGQVDFKNLAANTIWPSDILMCTLGNFDSIWYFRLTSLIGISSVDLEYRVIKQRNSGAGLCEMLLPVSYVDEAIAMNVFLEQVFLPIELYHLDTVKQNIFRINGKHVRIASLLRLKFTTKTPIYVMNRSGFNGQIAAQGQQERQKSNGCGQCYFVFVANSEHVFSQ